MPDQQDGGDAGATSKEELAGRANHQFEAKEYSGAVNTLEQLSASDPKVHHNLAVARYFLEGDAAKLYNLLSKTKETRKTSQNGEDYEDDETDSAVMCYNLAVVHYQNREFNAALSYLDRHVKVIEAIEEGVARKICLLLLDIYMMQFQPEKAAYILQYLERTLAGPQPADGKNKDDDKNSSDGGKSDGNEASTNPDLELLKFQLHQYRARMYIITRSMKACKREIKSALNFSNQSATALFLKSNFEYARHNYKKAIKLLNSCPKTDPHVSGQSLAGMYYNDLGCIHFQLQKYALAQLYFSKAVQANEEEAGRAPMSGDHKPLKTLVADRIHELMYNQGLNFLLMEKPKLAFDCFRTGMILFQSNPRFWLRLAECCIQLHVKKYNVAHGSDLNSYIKKAGSAQNRKIILRNPSSADGGETEEGLSLQNGVEYLNTALSLLDAAVAKTKGPNPASPPAAASPTGQAPVTAVSFALPGTRTSPIQQIDVPSIRCHILANLAYCHLGNANINAALTISNELIETSTCPGPLRFLAHLYAAESLVRQRKIPQAIQHLSPENIGDLSSGSTQEVGGDGTNNDASDADGSARIKEQAFTAESAKVILLVNIAVAYAIKGAYDSCLTCLTQVKSFKPSAEMERKVTLMAIYALLSIGRVDDALIVLEQNTMPQL